MDTSFLLNHLGEDRAAYFDAVSPPILQTSNFAFPTVAAFRAALADEQQHTLYTRGQNPTLVILNKKLAALDGAEDALCFSSGVAALSAAILNSVQTGDHVVCVRHSYGWTRHLLEHHLAKWGVSHTLVDGTRTEHIEAALQPNTRLIILESPTSFLFEVQDLAAVARMARARGIRTLMDNSYAGPLNPSPLGLGIDMVAYSGTKYHGGHSDVVCGVLSSSREIIRDIYKNEYMTLGQIPAPLTAWLVLRSLRTLHLRMARVADTTPKVVAYLAQHPKVDRVLYPHHPSHPQHSLAVQQQPQPTGLFSIVLKADSTAQVERFADALRCFLMAVSWGGHESLVIPACAFVSEQDTQPVLPFNLVRLYIGMEDAQVLIEDLAQALDKV
ncbi:MAG: PLP-dependent transferase [Bacteroidetes bacterium]|nr:PLP-dependent transferase [Bacteroidota bacterium]